MEDREIVREIVEQGRTGLFTEIVKRYSGLVYSKALGVVRREDLAADVTQTTFVKAYEQCTDIGNGFVMDDYVYEKMF